VTTKPSYLKWAGRYQRQGVMTVLQHGLQVACAPAFAPVQSGFVQKNPL